MFIIIIFFLVAVALPSLVSHTLTVNNFFLRTISSLLSYIGVLLFNIINIQSIGSGITMTIRLFQAITSSKNRTIILNKLDNKSLISWWGFTTSSIRFLLLDTSSIISNKLKVLPEALDHFLNLLHRGMKTDSSLVIKILIIFLRLRIGNIENCVRSKSNVLKAPFTDNTAIMKLAINVNNKEMPNVALPLNKLEDLKKIKFILWN